MRFSVIAAVILYKLGDIAVLFNQPSTKGELLKQINELKIGINTTDAEKLNENSIVVDTVRRFKGLE